MWASASHIGVAEPVILLLFIMDDALLPDVGISHIMSAVRYFHPTAVCRPTGVFHCTGTLLFITVNFSPNKLA